MFTSHKLRTYVITGVLLMAKELKCNLQRASDFFKSFAAAISETLSALIKLCFSVR